MDKLPQNVPAYLLGSSYDIQGKALDLIFYEPKTSKLFYWKDSSHDPYCLTNLSPFELELIDGVRNHHSFKGFEMVTKKDALLDKEIFNPS